MAQNQTACAFVQTIVTQDGKRQLAQLQMLEQKTEPATYILTMLLPLGLDIQNGVTAKIDQTDPIIPQFLTGFISRAYAAIFSFIAGIMPPMHMLGRSLL